MDLGSTMAEIGATGCDLKPGTEEHRQWALFQALSENAQRRVDGRVHRDSMAMKVLAEADFRAAGYGRPDPTVEILGLPDLPAVTYTPWTTYSGLGIPVTISVDAGQLQAVLKSLAEQLSTALRPITEHVTATFAALTEKIDWAGVLDADERRRVEQRRHGVAAVCPRHGPTRGGTCMRCAR